MSSTVWVKVVGFSGIERHSIRTLFRLSLRQTPSYSLWTPLSPSPPNVSLIDLDCHEADIELASPAFNPNHIVIGVGEKAQARTRHAFQRPVDWSAMVHLFDSLFATQSHVDVETGFEDTAFRSDPPGLRVSLLVGMNLQERLYLRARLALAGLTDVDDAETAEQASTRVAHRNYDVVIVSLELDDADPWALVQTLQGLFAPPKALIVATRNPSWTAMERAEKTCCAGLLEIPFSPPQVLALLQKV